MRVITGTAKGCKLKTIESLDTRPTLDRIKETMFNLIPESFYDKTCLDIFSGSGALGIEALSRGACECYFVDQSSECVKVIEDNLIHTRLKDKAFVYNSDVYKMLSEFAKNKKFDMIFLDPPYKKGHIDNAIQAIVENDLLTDEGLIIIECSSDEELTYKNIEIIKQRVVSKVVIYILGKK